MATQVSLNSGAVASAGALAIQTNGTTQAVSISTGQVATLAQNPILTSGTASGVAYLNGSKVLTTGSALVFDGSNFSTTGTTTASGYKFSYNTGLYTVDASISNYSAINSVYVNGNSGGYLVLQGAGNQKQQIGISGSNTGGEIFFTSNGSEAMRIAAATGGVGAVGIGYTSLTSVGNNGLAVLGNVGIGTSSPTARLSINTASDNSIAATIGGLDYSGTKRGLTIKTYQSVGGDDCGVEFNAADGLAGYGAFKFAANTTTLATIDASGNLLVGATSGANHVIYRATQSTILTVTSNTGADSIYVNGVGSTGANLGAQAALYVQKDTANNRSINAAGTINASGADYAEYMTKAGDFTIAKGDVVGIDENGKLTNVFADAISFVVKSTDPSYVGGDTWGSEESVGMKKPNDDATQEKKDAYKSAIESTRQRVDRIAFAGQVPVNVTGATAGQYIIPVNDNGAIKGEAVSNPTFEQYQIAVGKVIAIESDGRAKIIVKVA